MALIEHAYRLNNFEKEKNMRLDACDRPFPSSNELQRAPIPTRLRYPNCGIQDARALGELLQRNMDCRSNPSIGRHFVRRGARQRNRRRKCCLLMRTPAKEASNPTDNASNAGPSAVPGFRSQDRRSLQCIGQRWPTGAEPSAYAANTVSDLERAKGFEPSTPTLARLCPCGQQHIATKETER
jgi:hypothetical protein